MEERDRYDSILQIKREARIYDYTDAVARIESAGRTCKGPATAAAFTRACAVGNDPCDEWNL